ncbi:MAG TPA: TIGR03435 family protein [Bryobacteraceae bacterium]|jgi:uncharacterized protein (TIGR03435 family)
MPKPIAAAFFIVIAAFSLGAQSPAFEVATVRPAAPNPASQLPRMFQARGGPGTADPGQINYTGIPMRELLRLAYGLKLPYQFSGPGWMETERYDIAAKIPAGVTKEQFNVMLQNLLTERFAMLVHRETREINGYELSIGKGGLKFKESATPAPATAPAPPVDPNQTPRIKTEKDRDGKVQLAPGAAALVQFGIPGGIRYTARQQPISILTTVLENPLGKPLVDKTGLTGKYDFNLEFSRDVDAAADGPPDLFTAIQDQLGLKLEQKKIPVDVLIVDRAEKTPKEN